MQPFRIREKTKVTMVSVNYRKHFTDVITFTFTITCCYIHPGVRMYIWCHCYGVTVRTCPVSKPSIRTPGQFFHSGSDYSPGDWSKHSHSFLSHSARMFLPSHIPPFILLSTDVITQSTITDGRRGWLKIRHWPCLLPGEQMNNSYAVKTLPHT